MSTNDLTPDDVSVVLRISTITSSLSICGSVFILVCFFAFTHLRKFSFKLVAILSLTDIFNQFFDLLDPPSTDLTAGETSSLCMAQAVGDNFFELSSVMWTAAIAYTLYVTVMWRWTLEDNWRTIAKIAAVCYGIPLILTIAPAIDNAFGAGGAACWIKNDKKYWRYISFYVPLWLVIAFNAFVYIRVYKLMQRTIGSQGAADLTAQNIRKMMSRLSVYPFVLLAVWLIDSINRIFEDASGKQSLPLLAIGMGMAGMQGLLNAFAYGFSQGVRDAIVSVFQRCGLCKNVSSRELLVSPADKRESRVAAMRGGDDAVYDTVELTRV